MFNKQLLKLSVIIGTAATLALSQTYAEPTATKAVNQLATDFTAVAKQAIPAVVSIKVTIGQKQKSLTSNVWGQSEDDQSDNFNEQFWQRFFGMPYKDSQAEPRQGQASGFLISSDGYILTNSHVVQDATDITVQLNDGQEFTGKVVGQDPNTDIAVVKIDAKNLPYLTFGNSEDLEVGQWVIAIGNPFGLQASLTVGVVSAKGRNNLDLARIEDFIQTDAAINKGNSGGPLLDLNGKVIGMNTAIVSNMGGYVGVGFAIPSNIALHIKDQLIAKGSVSRGFIGVLLQKVDKDLATAFHLDRPEGALISQVSKDSPAEKAGIKQGDVIVKYNGTQVSNIGALRNAVSLMEPGANLKLSILREGKPMEINVQIGDFSSSQTTKAKIEENALGLTVENLSPEVAQKLGFNGEKGVVITKIEPGSMASKVGLRKGSLIVAVNQKKIENVDQFKTALQGSEKGNPVLLLIKDGDATRFVSFRTN